MAERLSEAAAAANEPAAKPAKRGRGRPPKATTTKPAVVSNVTQETIAAAIVECGAAKADLDSAQGIYRNALKKWEERGVDAGDIVWFLKLKKREVADIEAEIRRRNRILVAMSFPIGAQLGLFDDGESVGTKVDRAKAPPIVTDDDIAVAKARGYEAGAKGIGEEANPHAEGSPLALAWAAERRRATGDRAREVFGGGKTGEDLAGEAVDGMRELRGVDAAGSA